VPVSDTCIFVSSVSRVHVSGDLAFNIREIQGDEAEFSHY
jgi:hypothetical protein